MLHLIHRLTETVSPAIEPLTLAEIKTFLRIDHNDDDAFVTDLILAARQLCESVTGRSLITRSYSLYLDFWPDAPLTEWWDGVREGADVVGKIRALSLPKPPLLSITQIKVYAADDTSADFPSASYYVDTVGIPGRIVLTHGSSSPVPGRAANGIEIQFTAGYGTTAQSVPALLRQGMKQVIAHLYEHRGDSADQALLASGASVIFQSYRIMSLS